MLWTPRAHPGRASAVQRAHIGSVTDLPRHIDKRFGLARTDHGLAQLRELRFQLRVGHRALQRTDRVLDEHVLAATIFQHGGDIGGRLVDTVVDGCDDPAPQGDDVGTIDDGVRELVLAGAAEHQSHRTAVIAR